MKIKLSDLKPTSQEFMGIYRGVVEDRNDPEKRGRVRVRIFGIHNESREKDDTGGIPIDELPWAEPALPIFEGAVSGFGMFNVPVTGSHVFCFFETGNHMHPRYFATAPAQPKEQPNNKDGFSDPNNIYPTEHRLEEPDYHRLARGEKEKTVIEDRNNKRDTGVVAAGGESWDEPESYYNASYPDNTVLATHGGVLMELDGTKDNQRLHLYHPSNSFLEIGPDGDMIFKNDGDEFRIVEENRRTHVKCQDWLTVDKQRKIKVTLDELKEVGETQFLKVGGNRELVIEGDQVVTINGNYTINVKGNITINGEKSYNVNANEASSVKSPGKADLVDGSSVKGINGNEKKQVAGNRETKIAGNSETTVTGTKTITATKIYLN
jgi:hypothetical protein